MTKRPIRGVVTKETIPENSKRSRQGKIKSNFKINNVKGKGKNQEIWDKYSDK